MTAPHHPKLIEVKIQTLSQLFDSMDPAPFHERDLDANAAEFILESAREHHVNTPLRLVVHLAQAPNEAGVESLVTNSIHHYFKYRAMMNLRAIRNLMHDGWISLLIGLLFLGSCVFAAQTIAPHLARGGRVLEEGLTIIGWVAMWRPIDIYLYRWWPLRRLARYHRKLAGISVKVRLPVKH